MRMIWLSFPAVFVLAAVPLAASAADKETDSVLADCGPSGLSTATVDSCLERIRVLDETNPSPALQSLEAKLEEQKSGPRHDAAASGPPRQLQALQEETVAADPVVVQSPPPPDALMATPAAPTTQPSESSENPQADSGYSANARPGSSETAPASLMDDEPPIADPPDDAPAGADDPQ